MKKSELIKIVAKETGYDTAMVDDILKSITKTITQSLKENKCVSLHGFGKFIARSYGKRKCYNPITGEMQMLSPSIQPAFIPGVKMREELNEK